jgi:hypothetical protein
MFEHARVALCQQHRLDEASQAAHAQLASVQILRPIGLRGNIAVERGRDNAAQSSARVIKLDPGFSEAYYWLARSYHREANGASH